MAESNSKLPAPLQKFVTDLREKLIKTEAQIRELRAREASTKTQTLAKHELCPLCGGPDINARCPCIDKLQKNAVMGYPQSTPGSGMPSNTGMGAMGGGGTPSMAMAEKKDSGLKHIAEAKQQADRHSQEDKREKQSGDKKNADSKRKDAQQAADDKKTIKKNELCKNCGKSHDMGKCSMDEVTPGKKLEKDYAGLSDMSQLSKKTPEGISEKTMHKLKDEYGHDKEGKAKAYATANAIASGTVNHKAEINATPHLDDAKSGLAKASMPSSSAAAISPPKPRPATPVAAANKELGGFKSLVHSPTAMPSAAGPGLAPGGARKPLASMGRAGVSNSATAGTIPNAKSEKNPGSATSPYGTGGPGHASQTNMPSALKDNMAVTKAEMSKPYAAKVGITDHRNKAKAAYGDGPHDQRPAMHQAHMGPLNNASPAPPPVRKDEKELAPTPAVPEKKVEGAKLPKAGKSVDAKKTGAGGQIKGNPLQKDAPALAAPEGKGVGGRQMAGQGGGDAPKPAGKLPGPGGTKGLSGPTKSVPKPAPKGPSALRSAGSAEVGRMIADKGPAGNPNAKGPLPSSDVDVSEFDKGPNRLAPFKGAGGQADPTAGMKQMVHPNVMADRQKAGVHPMTGIQGEGLQNVRDDLNVAADKKAGGVGFLRGLMSMFSRAPGQSVQPTGKGMRPAPTASVDQAVRQLGGNNGNITRPTDSTGGVATGPAAPAGQLSRAPMTRMRGAMPLQRSEAAWDLGACALCHGPEHTGTCK